MGVEKRKKEKKPLRVMKVELIDLDLLKYHEDIIEEEIDLFLKSLKEKNVFYKPIIVEKDNFVILDGHHRVEGLKRFGAKRVPAILVDYLKNPEIKVYGWYPVLYGEKEKILFVLENTKGMEIKEGNKELAIKEAKEGKISFALVSENECYSLNGNQRIAIKMLENTKTVYIEYFESEKDAFRKLKSATFVMIRKKITKEDVIRMGLSKDVYAPKTSRHYLPFRYQNINVKPQELL